MNGLEQFDQYCNNIDKEINKEQQQSFALAKALAANKIISRNEVNDYANNYSAKRLKKMLEQEL